MIALGTYKNLKINFEVDSLYNIYFLQKYLLPNHPSRCLKKKRVSFFHNHLRSIKRKQIRIPIMSNYRFQLFKLLDIIVIFSKYFNWKYHHIIIIRLFIYKCINTYQTYIVIMTKFSHT